ncbi:helix-turn-helix domain-containing protein [Parasedimentitalea huanghaiensis]|uniref:Helix-turn-helix domain-containing protein n=1 Tax=Parasedimentitalea huanghaiensis TaxID=2682100 RepID=A0A6L6WCT3_9RHOB|nr:AraC family transcriptional regulator [Zongyanglinia huanghaiensis]MVO14689.1 helix-turn-helix domain-containing protein [Zongyanglinia huanghaiensis]
MIYLDLALRGGAITVLLLLALLLWRAPISLEGRLSVSALALSESAFLIITAALPLDLHPALHSNLTLIASFTPAAITWLIVTIFLDSPGQRWPWLVASLATSAALYTHESFPDLYSVCLPMSVILYGALFILSLWSTRDDLVECRCRARPGFAAAIAGLALFLTAGQATGLLQEDSLSLALLQAAGTLAVTLNFAVWLLRPDAHRWPGETSPEISNRLPVQDEFSDPTLIAGLQSAMSAGIWREEGLTIGALAGKIAVPEHRLRRAINQGLGYRNFSSFINQARIEAACAALSDPAQMNATVLEIAYEVGFASVGPFNRAFRAEIGCSPTEYRRSALSRAYTDSEKSSPIAANLH